MKHLLAIALTVFLASASGLTQSSTPSVSDTFHIKSDGWWDYILVDTLSDKLFVSHGSQVNVLNKTNGDSLGIIPNTMGVHGIALVHSLNKGFTSNGKSNSVTVFDLDTFTKLDTIATGKNPDVIFYDAYSQRIITCNGGSHDISIIDPANNKVVATIDVKGKPETAVSDGKGRVFINNEDRSEIEVIDMKSLRLIHSWTMAPGESPSGLSIDRGSKRLFAGCDNKILIVMDATNGKVVAKVPIGDGCDGTAFDPLLKTIYSSNGEGTLTIIHELSKDKFEVVKNLPTRRGARTLSVDTKTHVVYLPTADFGTATVGERRPPMIPGTFRVLVVKY